ncbi:hypothetical protein ES708_24163 [subsurface metagenome]
MVSRIFSYIGKFVINPKKAAEEIAEDNLGLWRVGELFHQAYSPGYRIAFTFRYL